MATRKTSTQGRPLPALPDSKLLSPSRQDVDTADRNIEVHENCEDPNSKVCGHLRQTGTQRTELTDIRTYSQLPGPVTAGFVGNQKYGAGALRQVEMQEQYPDTYGSNDEPADESHYTEDEDTNDPRQASQQSGQLTADLEDADRMGRNGARLLENPMYAAGVLSQNDGGPSSSSFRETETKEESPGTEEFHAYENPDNDGYHYIDDDEITNPGQGSQQHGGQPTAEDTDETGRNYTGLLKSPMYREGVLHQDDGEPIKNTPRSKHSEKKTAEDIDKNGRNSTGLLKNPMYVSGVLRQDFGGNNDAADSCVFPRCFCVQSHRSFVILLVIIAIVVAVVIGAGAGLIVFLTTVQETHPPTLNSSLERSGTSSRPVSPFPATPTGSIRENKNGNLSPMTIVTTEDATATDQDLETRVFPQIGTAKAVMSETTTKVLAQYVERTGFDQLQKTTKQQILTTRKGCPTVVLYGSTTLQVSRMTSYKMTGDTREGRPVYYSHATCEFLYYKCGDYLKWCVGRWVGSKYRSINVRDSHLYADEINETFFLWDGRQWIGNTDVKIACSDDAPAGAVVPQPESNAKDCPRVSLQGDATYQPSRMTTYTRTNQTSGGRPVYVSDTDSRDFLFFFGERNQWWVGRTIGKDNGGAHIGDCAMTPDQTRPLWELWDGGVWRFVPSVHATCVGLASM